jgi:hypothetical protein
VYRHKAIRTQWGDGIYNGDGLNFIQTGNEGGYVCLCTPVISALGRLRQRDQETSIDSLKKKKKKDTDSG